MLLTQCREKNRSFVGLVNKLIAQGIWGTSEKSAEDSNSNTILNEFITLYTKIDTCHAKCI